MRGEPRWRVAAEWFVRAGARGLQQVERAHRVGVEVVERDRRRPVVAGLGRRVHDCLGPQFRQQSQHP